MCDHYIGQGVRASLTCKKRKVASTGAYLFVSLGYIERHLKREKLQF
jgi:hypothetical protein